MILNHHNTSLKIAKQLPEFIRDDVNYETFVAFLQAYYAWLETSNTANSSNTVAHSSNQGITHASQNLLNYSDVDNTINDFIQYYINDFLPYIPEDALTDKRKLLKISKEFYHSKGTEKSYKFLFRALYNENAEIFETGDSVLKSSAGKWIIPKLIRINTTTNSWEYCNGFKLFGEESKAFANIDEAFLTTGKAEIYISSINRIFKSGEFVRVLDNNNKDVYFYNDQIYIQNQGYEIPSYATILREKIVGIVNSVTIDPDNKGLYYKAGDPVVAYGGLNPAKDNPVAFSGIVGTTTTGSIKSLNVSRGSNGYRLSPNTKIILDGDGQYAAGEVTLLDDNKQTFFTMVSSNTIGAVANVRIGNTMFAQTYTTFAVAANSKSTLANTLTFKAYSVFPIAGVNVTNPGVNYPSPPPSVVISEYETQSGTDDFAYLGVLQPIEIVNGGTGYGNSNTISIVGGTGFGAYANIRVNSAGSIISANYIYSSSNTITSYPLGGLGYLPNYLPTINISSISGANASLIVPGVMAIGASLDTVSEKIGAISSIKILNSGEDYISSPNLTVKVADVTVTNVSTIHTFTSGDLIFQGASLNTKSFYASVDSYRKISTAVPKNTSKDVYLIRMYEYFGSYDPALPLKIIKNITTSQTYTLVMYPSNNFTDAFGNLVSIKQYGDGLGKIYPSFLGGVIDGQGKYLNEDGHISSLGIVLQSIDYNTFTYILSSPETLAKYKNLVLNLVHPAGMRLVGRKLISSANTLNMSISDKLQFGVPLAHVAGSAAFTTLAVDTSLNEKTLSSNNIIKFTNVIAGNIGNTIFANDIVQFNATNNIKAYSTITNVDWSNNQIYMKDNVYLTFRNVATCSINASSNVINIDTLTGQFDGNFGTLYDFTPSNVIFSVGDSVLFNSEGTYHTITKMFSNGNFSINSSSLGPRTELLITVNKNANTKNVMIYGTTTLYAYPEITTESGDSILTESGAYLLIG